MARLLRRTRRPARGFTLIELGVVLAVSAILAAAILPDFIEASRSKMAEKAAQDVAVIHDAARWFFVQSGNSTVYGAQFVWPGEPTPNTCTNSPGNDPVKVLSTSGYLMGIPVNPWGQPYDTEVKSLSTATTGGVQFGCSLSVTTNVPSSVANSFKGFLPQGLCSDPKCKAGTVPAGFTRCCSFVPKPGVGISGPCPPPRHITVEPVTGIVKCTL